MGTPTQMLFWLIMLMRLVVVPYERKLLIICNAYLKVVFLVECGLHMKVNCVMK